MNCKRCSRKIKPIMTGGEGTPEYDCDYIGYWCNSCQCYTYKYTN